MVNHLGHEKGSNYTPLIEGTDLTVNHVGSPRGVVIMTGTKGNTVNQNGSPRGEMSYCKPQ